MILSSPGMVSNDGEVFFASTEAVLSMRELFELGSVSKALHQPREFDYLQHLAVGAVCHFILPKTRQLVKWRIRIWSHEKASVDGRDKFGRIVRKSWSEVRTSIWSEFVTRCQLYRSDVKYSPTDIYICLSPWVN